MMGWEIHSNSKAMVEIKSKMMMASRGPPLMEIKMAGSKVNSQDNSKDNSKFNSREVNRPGRFNKHIFMMGDLVEWSVDSLLGRARSTS